MVISLKSSVTPLLWRPQLFKQIVAAAATSAIIGSMASSPTPTKRMEPAQRRGQILEVARVVLSRDGLDRFSLEAVAREAGVAATLPRHYFESRDGLLIATAIEVIEELTNELTVSDPERPLADRLRAYVDLLAENPWAHLVWMRAPNLHPELDEVVRRIHRRLVEISFGRRWDALSDYERIVASGWIGYANASVSQWIEQGAEDKEVLLRALLEGARRHEVNGL
jgi:AcrR family transcriptional regulator